MSDAVNIPEITEVQRYLFHPGDRFILHVDYEIDSELAQDMVARFSAALQLPEGTPVAVLGSGWNLTIAGPAGVDGCLWCLDHFDESEACVCSRNCGDAQCRTARS